MIKTLILIMFLFTGTLVAQLPALEEYTQVARKTDTAYFVKDAVRKPSKALVIDVLIVRIIEEDPGISTALDPNNYILISLTVNCTAKTYKPGVSSGVYGSKPFKGKGLPRQKVNANSPMEDIFNFVCKKPRSLNEYTE